MRVSLIDITEKPIEKIYKSYRICYSKDSWDDIKIPTCSVNMYKGDGDFEVIKENDIEKMINFIIPLMEEQHTSPLEMVNFTFYIEDLSRAALAQITRHRTFKFNVQSQRYINANNFKFSTPTLNYIEDEKERKDLKESINLVSESLINQYNYLVSKGIKKEDARAILPMNTTCNLIVNMDLNNFRNFLRQRLCGHAQEEIRMLAKEMVNQIKEYIPFVDHKVLLCQQGLCKRGNKHE